MKECPKNVNKRHNWVLQIKDILYTSGFGYIWEQQTVANKEKFLRSFEARCKDMYMQQCLGNINASSRCRLYRNLKEDFELAPYLRKN